MYCIPHQESEALNVVRLGEMIDIKQVSDVSSLRSVLLIPIPAVLWVAAEFSCFMGTA